MVVAEEKQFLCGVVEGKKRHLLSKNKNAIHILRENLHHVNWIWLSRNENAISLLRENKDKIYWRSLSRNENAIDLLKEHQDNIDWFYLSSNPSIFTDELMPELL